MNLYVCVYIAIEGVINHTKSTSETVCDDYIKRVKDLCDTATLHSMILIRQVSVSKIGKLRISIIVIIIIMRKKKKDVLVQQCFYARTTSACHPPNMKSQLKEFASDWWVVSPLG